LNGSNLVRLGHSLSLSDQYLHSLKWAGNVLDIVSTLALKNLGATREYATFEDQGSSYMWAREEHDPDKGPDVLLNLSVGLFCNAFRQMQNLRDI